MSQTLLASVSESLNTTEAAIRLLISILLGFPIAILHRRTLYGKRAILQHAFFTVCGVLLCLWNYGLNSIHSATAILVTYCVLKSCGGSSLSVLLTFLFNMTYLLIGYHVTSTDDYDIKWTMPQCVLTLRLIGLSFNLLDARKPEEKLSESQKRVALKERPTLLEIAAFTYFPGSFLVGPQYSMKRYLDYVHGRLINENTPASTPKADGIQSELEDSLIRGVSRLSVGLVYLALYQLGTTYVPTEYLFTTQFLEHGFFKRLALIGFWGHFAFYKYIACWLIAEGVCTVFGLTYNGRDKDGRAIWDGCENVKLSMFENATKFNDYIMSFNINTNTWCAEYIYKRLKFMGSRLASQFFTLLFLAIWHGFHSGYYVCFFLEFMVMYLEKDVTGILKRHGKIPELLKKRPELDRLANLLLRLYTAIFMSYCFACFILLSFPRYHQLYSSVYYCGHVLYLGYPFVSILLKKTLLKKRPNKDE